MSEIADRGPTRRRTIGPRGDGERSRLPQQRPWAQPRMRYKPTEVMSADELESIHEASLDVLEEIGMDFLDPEARDVLAAAGAKVEPGTQRVRFDRGMVLERIKTAPSQFTLHAPNPAHDLQIGGDWMAFGSVASAPNAFDMDGGRRVGNHADYQNFIRLGHMLNAVHFFSGYPVEPIDIHPSIRHLDAIYDILTLADKPLHAYSLGRQRNLDALEMARIRRGIDEATLDSEPSIFTVINSSSPLRLDLPMLQGILAYSARNQVIVMTPFTLAGAMAPVTLAGALVEQNAEALAGITLTQVVRPGRARRLRRVHVERGHAVRGAGVRDARVHADRDGRRPARPALQPAVSLLECVRLERARHAGGLRVGLLAVGRGHGRRQPDDARRRLDGGRPPRRVREDDRRRRAAPDGRGVPGSDRRGRRDAWPSTRCARWVPAATSSAPPTRSRASGPRSTSR